MNLRKPKFRDILSKWEKRRKVRQWKREREGKPATAKPLMIASASERRRALRDGNMVFYHGTERIELPLHDLKRHSGQLTGVYVIGDQLITLRHQGKYPDSMILFNGLRKENDGLKEERISALHPLTQEDYDAFVTGFPDLGHMLIPPELQGKGLAMKAASKAERQVRTYKGGSHTFDVPEKGFPGIYYLYKSLGYRGDGFTLQKDSRASPQDDLSKNYRIEAIDPKTGKARIFTFPIKD